MAKSKAKDIFTNLAYAAVTESAANTLTFSEINTGVSVAEKIAWIINRIDWWIERTTQGQVFDDGDGWNLGLVANNKVTALTDLSDPAILASVNRVLIEVGVAATVLMKDQPIISDFSRLPGGGIIITPKPLYIAAQGLAQAAAGTYACRIYYTTMTLAADEFWELVQASRIVQ